MKEISMILIKKAVGLVLVVFLLSSRVYCAEMKFESPYIGCMGLSKEKAQKILDQIHAVLEKRIEVLQEIEKVRYNLAIRKGYRPLKTNNGLRSGHKVVFNYHETLNHKLRTGIIAEVLSQDVVKVMDQKTRSKFFILDSSVLCKKRIPAIGYKVGDRVCYGAMKDRVGKIIDLFECNIVHIRDEETGEDVYVKDHNFHVIADGETCDSSTDDEDIEKKCHLRELQLPAELKNPPKTIKGHLTAREAYELVETLEEAFDALRLVEKKLIVLERKLAELISFDRSDLEIFEGDTVLYTRKQVKVGYGDEDIYVTLRDEAKVLKIFDCGLVHISFAGKNRKVPASNLSKKILANKRYQGGDRVILEGKPKEDGQRNLMVGQIKAVYDGRTYLIAFESQILGQAERLDYFSNKKYRLTLIAKTPL